MKFPDIITLYSLIFTKVLNFLHREHVLIFLKWPDVMIFYTAQ